MALNWKWDERIGTLEYSQTIEDEVRHFKSYLYEGNAKLIVLNEWKDGDSDMYSLNTFWIDKVHMNNCLGLTKGHSNIYTGWNKWDKLTFYKDKISQKNLVEIVSALVKAFPNITIEIKETEGGK